MTKAVFIQLVTDGAEAERPPGMNELDRVCARCGADAESAPIERCRMCHSYFCADCAHKAMGNRFCSERCGVAYAYGDSDDDEDRTENDFE